VSCQRRREGGERERKTDEALIRGHAICLERPNDDSEKPFAVSTDLILAMKGSVGIITHGAKQSGATAVPLQLCSFETRGKYGSNY